MSICWSFWMAHTIRYTTYVLFFLPACSVYIYVFGYIPVLPARIVTDRPLTVWRKMFHIHRGHVSSTIISPYFLPDSLTCTIHRLLLRWMGGGSIQTWYRKLYHVWMDSEKHTNRWKKLSSSGIIGTDRVLTTNSRGAEWVRGSTIKRNDGSSNKPCLWCFHNTPF